MLRSGWVQRKHRVSERAASLRLTRSPLTSTTSLPGGGVAYNYDLPDGQVISFPQTPSGFNASTATPAEDEAYGVPPAPAAGSAPYAGWLQETDNWSLSPGDNPYVVGSSYQSTLDARQDRQIRPAAAFSPQLTYEPGQYWGGYVTSGSGWTRVDAEYYEPHEANTSAACPNPAVTFWSGIGGYNSNDLGQDGTASGVLGFPLHAAWFEVLPGSMYEYDSSNDPTASAGTFVQDITDYPQSRDYQLTVVIGNTPHVVDESGDYDGNYADIIAERPQDTGSTVSSGPASSDHVPLLNFQSIVMRGLLGQGEGELGSAAQAIPMTGFAQLGGVSYGQFTETDEHCAG